MKKNYRGCWQALALIFIGWVVSGLAQAEPLVTEAAPPQIVTSDTVPSSTHTVDASTPEDSSHSPQESAATTTTNSLTPGKINNSQVRLKTSSSAANLTSIFVGLMAILLIIFALAWLAKRLGGGTLLATQHIKIAATLPLGTRERLVVIDVAGKQMLLGMTAQQISHLHTFDEAVIDLNKSPTTSEFSKKLQSFLTSKNVSEHTSSEQVR